MNFQIRLGSAVSTLVVVTSEHVVSQSNPGRAGQAGALTYVGTPRSVTDRYHRRVSRIRVVP